MRRNCSIVVKRIVESEYWIESKCDTVCGPGAFVIATVDIVVYSNCTFGFKKFETIGDSILLPDAAECTTNLQQFTRRKIDLLLMNL